jgi:hypothetical protein
MGELDFKIQFSYFETWKIPNNFIVLQIHLNHSNVKFPYNLFAVTDNIVYKYKLQKKLLIFFLQYIKVNILATTYHWQKWTQPHPRLWSASTGCTI